LTYWIRRQRDGLKQVFRLATDVDLPEGFHFSDGE
jgi:hypothetical protein